MTYRLWIQNKDKEDFVYIVNPVTDKFLDAITWKHALYTKQFWFLAFTEMSVSFFKVLCIIALCSVANQIPAENTDMNDWRFVFTCVFLSVAFFLMILWGYIFDRVRSLRVVLVILISSMACFSLTIPIFTVREENHLGDPD